jgi:NAD(P)-dependent dehydrogenase (short-subunit alcohol dehydrogenase family)
MKTIVITGASDGIGAELARQLARRDDAKCSLVLAARNRDALDAVAAQCQAFGAQTLVVPTDVGVQVQCRALIDAAVQRFGGIDALVNNAGLSAQALFEDVQDLGWYEDLMRVNLWGSVWCTHAALTHLKASKGRIVAVSSLAGLIGVPGRTAYSATKFAMTGVVATQIRYRGYTAAGQAAGASGLKEDDAMSVEECARLIREGMERRQREVVMTGKGKLGRFLKLVAPGMVENMALAVLKDEVRPK